MQFRHFVITRFSYRGKNAFEEIAGPTFHRDEDPLEPERLEFRFKLFELTCLPTILAQSEQSFTWILLVDRELPRTYHDRLQTLVKPKNVAFIHAFDPQVSLASLDWLKPYLGDGSDYVITTNLDDDDSLPTRFFATIHERLHGLETADKLPLIGFIGARRIVEWDLLTSRDAPLGWKAAWHRETSVASGGLSLFCKFPEFNSCVLAVRHGGADTYLDFSKPPPHRNVRWFQRAIVKAARAIHVDARTWNHEDLFYDISKDLGPVLMTNHVGNDQAQRLFEEKPNRTIVTGPGDLPDFPIDWEKARRYANAFAVPGAEAPQSR